MKSKCYRAISVLLSVLLLAACTAAKPEVSGHETTMKPEELKPYKKLLGELNLTIDPGTELLSAVQNAAGYDILTPLKHDYRSAMTEYFDSFKEHEAVKKFAAMRERGFSFHVPPAVMAHLSAPPALEYSTAIPKEYLNRSGGKKSLNDFISKLRAFYTETDFESFYKSNDEFYNAVLNKVSDDIKDFQLEARLNEYYGMKANSYNLVLAPMLHTGGYGIRVKNANGQYDVYAFIGPMDIYTQNAGAYNKLPSFSKEEIASLVWHEFSHSFVNPTTEKYSAEIYKYSKLFAPIKDIMSKQQYPEWLTCVNEHIVRAVTTRMAYIYGGKADGDASLHYEKSCGFYYVEALCRSLEVYEKNRDKYPALEDYYPELIKVFKELSEKELGEDFFTVDYNGPINASFDDKNMKRTVIIIPTNEKDEAVEKDIGVYCRALKEKVFKDSEVLTDMEALEKDLSDYMIICYGTMEGNLWLAKHEDILPFRVESGKIIADKVYEETGLVLISGLPNPQNCKLPLLVYTAQNAKDIIEINSIYHGSTDYVIAKSGEIVFQGNYLKNGKHWSFE